MAMLTAVGALGVGEAVLAVRVLVEAVEVQLQPE
jgi:hypothetical protein